MKQRSYVSLVCLFCLVLTLSSCVFYTFNYRLGNAESAEKTEGRIDQLKKNLHRLKENITCLTNILENLKESFEGSREKLLELKENLHGSTEEYSGIKELFIRSKKKFEGLKANLSGSKDEIYELKKTIMELKDSVNKIKSIVDISKDKHITQEDPTSFSKEPVKYEGNRFGMGETNEDSSTVLKPSSEKIAVNISLTKPSDMESSDYHYFDSVTETSYDSKSIYNEKGTTYEVETSPEEQKEHQDESDGYEDSDLSMSQIFQSSENGYKVVDGFGGPEQNVLQENIQNNNDSLEDVGRDSISSNELESKTVVLKKFLPVTDEPEDWATAAELCENQDMALATIDNPQEQDQLVSIIRERGLYYGDFWIDGYGLEGAEVNTYKWAERDTYITYSNFDLSQPRTWSDEERTDRSSCIYLAHDHEYKWKTRSCDTPMYYICEYSHDNIEYNTNAISLR